MDWASLSYPFSLGMIAAFNPCGFALLPAYLGYFIGSDDPGKSSSGGRSFRAMLRAMGVALTLTAGFVVVFGTFGALFETVLNQGTVLENIGYVTIVIGVIMAALGAWMLAGKTVSLRLPKLSLGGESRGLRSIFLFGVSYAVVSLSCTIGLFIAAVAASFSADGVAGGTGNFIAYGMGMGAVITFLTMTLATARKNVAQSMRKASRWINPISGLVLLASGVYLMNYGWWELQIIDDPRAHNVLVENFTEFQSAVTNWIDATGSGRLGLVCGLGVLGTLVVSWCQGSTSVWARRLVVSVYALVYLVVEFVFNQGEFVLLPVLRFVAGWPQRLINWFSDPTRFGVPLEIVFVALVLWMLLRTFRNIRQQRNNDDSVPETDKAADTASQSS